MRVTFVSACLECGGAERAVVSLAQELMRRGNAVTVITLSGDEKDFYSLPEGITRLGLNIVPPIRVPNMPRLRASVQRRPALRRALSAINRLLGFRHIAGRLPVLRRAIVGSRPDVIVSSLQHVNVMTLLALMGTSRRLVVVEHNHPAMLSCGQPWNLLRRVSYARAARFVSVSQEIDQCFNWLPGAKRAVIHNALTPDLAGDPPSFAGGDEKTGSKSPAAEAPHKKLLVAMGRLIHLKGFDLLLLAFARIAEKHADWDLTIIGEGESRSQLEELRDRLGLNDRVTLTGQLSDPFTLLRQAQLFVLPSRTEGFPTVLIEAMACGVPVIATDCHSGPGEIVRDGDNGLLVPMGDVPALANAMDRLMSDELERKRLAHGEAEMKERFGVERITDAWEALLHSVASEAVGQISPPATARETDGIVNNPSHLVEPGKNS